MTKDEALGALKELEALVKNFGAADAASLQRVKRILSDLESGRMQNRDGSLRMKATDLRGWADVGFSRDKFDHYNGGLPQVRRWAIADISAIRDLVNERWVA